MKTRPAWIIAGAIVLAALIIAAVLIRNEGRARACERWDRTVTAAAAAAPTELLGGLVRRQAEEQGYVMGLDGERVSRPGYC